MHGFGLHPHNFVKVIEMTKEIHRIQSLLNQKHCDPARIRTKNPLIRSQMTYPLSLCWEKKVNYSRIRSPLAIAVVVVCIRGLKNKTFVFFVPVVSLFFSIFFSILCKKMKWAEHDLTIEKIAKYFFEHWLRARL